SRAFGMRDSKMGQGIFLGALIGFGIMGISDVYFNGNLYLLYLGLVLFGFGNLYAGLKFYLTIDENLVFDQEVNINNKINSKLSYREFIRSLPKGMALGLFLILVVLTMNTTNSQIAKPFILVYLTLKVESNPVLAAMAFIPAGITSMLLAPRLGGLADRMNAKIVIAVGASAGALTTWFLINTTILWLFSLLLIVDMTIAITTGLVIQSIMSKISVAHRGKVFGLQTLFMDLGAIVGPIVGGILWDTYDFRAPFIFSISVELLLIPLYVIALNKITPYLAENTIEVDTPTILESRHAVLHNE
ncbi:MAG: MFS transporter, partial [Candidatus Heimdallarchaeota archaeon]